MASQNRKSSPLQPPPLPDLTRLRKSQYVSQLGKWNYTKYSKDTDPHDWKVAAYKVSKAKKRGKQVQLHLKGNLVTGKVLRTRGYLTSLDQMQLEGESSIFSCSNTWL